jgi:hypothetical protein
MNAVLGRVEREMYGAVVETNEHPNRMKSIGVWMA